MVIQTLKNAYNRMSSNIHVRETAKTGLFGLLAYAGVRLIGHIIGIDPLMYFLDYIAPTVGATSSAVYASKSPSSFVRNIGTPAAVFAVGYTVPGVAEGLANTIPSIGGLEQVLQGKEVMTGLAAAVGYGIYKIASSSNSSTTPYSN